METVSEDEPGPPLRASTPVMLEEEDGEHILLEDTLPLERTQGASEEEKENEERNLEICLWMEANMLEERTHKAMRETGWRPGLLRMMLQRRLRGTGLLQID